MTRLFSILLAFVLPSSILAASGGGVTYLQDSRLLFYDILTGNASTTAHGFMPKLNGNSSYFFAGDGTWRIPGGGPGGSLPTGLPGQVIRYDSTGSGVATNLFPTVGYFTNGVTYFINLTDSKSSSGASSATNAWPGRWFALYPPSGWIFKTNAAVVNDKLTNIHARLSTDIAPYAPNGVTNLFIHLDGGVNDALAGSNAVGMLTYHSNIVTAIKAINSRIKVQTATLMQPMAASAAVLEEISTFNSLLRNSTYWDSLFDAENFVWVSDNNFIPDGLHMTNNGHVKYALGAAITAQKGQGAIFPLYGVGAQAKFGNGYSDANGANYYPFLRIGTSGKGIGGAVADSGLDFALANQAYYRMTLTDFRPASGGSYNLGSSGQDWRDGFFNGTLRSTNIVGNSAVFTNSVTAGSFIFTGTGPSTNTYPDGASHTLKEISSAQSSDMVVFRPPAAATGFYYVTNVSGTMNAVYVPLGTGLKVTGTFPSLSLIPDLLAGSGVTLGTSGNSITIANSSGAGIPNIASKKWARIAGTGAAFSVTGDGATETAGTGTIAAGNATATQGGNRKFTTAASSGTGPFIVGNTIWRVGRNIDASFKHSMGQSANERIWAVMTDQAGSTQAGSATPAGNYAGFLYDTTTDATHIIFVTKDNSSPTTSAITLQDTSPHVVRVKFNDAIPNVEFYVDGTLITTHTTHLPTVGTNLRYAYTTAATTSSSIDGTLEEIYIEADR